MNMKKSLKSTKRMYEASFIEAETPTSLPRGPARLAGESVDGLIDAIADEWDRQYDESDPVQGAYGEEAWSDQVDRAALALQEKIEEAIEEVESDLHNGEFADTKKSYTHKPFSKPPRGYGQGE